MWVCRQGGFDMRRLKTRLIAAVLMFALIMPLTGCSLITDITVTI